jgi:4-hydroxy-4-methyl-2-oxoglutarate aldolase
MTEYPVELLRLAKSLGTSTLYEASGIKNCALDNAIRPIWDKAIIAGSAYPVACAPGDNLGVQLALEKAPVGSIMVVTTGDYVAGYWGEILTLAAMHVGILGLVIDGGVRDVVAIRELKFPVYSRGISVHGTHKDTLVSVGADIQITGTPVQAGDLVVADDDGIIVLPKNQVNEVVRKGKEREEKEQEMMKQIKNGVTTVDIMGLSYWRDKL